MKNKYYTPTIEEFHVGFEYEEGDFIGQPNEFWEKQICGKDDTGDLEFYNDVIREHSIRVKLLDREDIESLGWVFDNDDCHFDYLKYRLLFNNGVVDIRVVGDSYREEYCFNGKIKNKSELQKLMMQLGIK